MKIKIVNFFLSLLFKVDQKVRYRGKYGVLPVKITDTITTNILKFLIGTLGTDFVCKLGESGVNRFITLSCHSRNLKFIESICESDEILKCTSDREKVAILIDNALVRSGKKQRFGEIMQIHKNIDGKSVSEPLPLQNPKNVNKIRADFGLSQSLEEHIKWANEQFENMKVPD